MSKPVHALQINRIAYIKSYRDVGVLEDADAIIKDFTEAANGDEAELKLLVEELFNQLHAETVHLTKLMDEIAGKINTKESTEQKLENLFGDKDYSRGLKIGNGNDESGLSKDTQAIIAAIRDLKTTILESGELDLIRRHTSKQTSLLVRNLIDSFQYRTSGDVAIVTIKGPNGYSVDIAEMSLSSILDATRQASKSLGFKIEMSHATEESWRTFVWFKQLN